MRVISWNMGMARRGRRTPDVHEQVWHYLLGLGPDIAFVQEALPPAWVRGEAALVHGPFTQWGSVIFSPRFPLERFRLPEEKRGWYDCVWETRHDEIRTWSGAVRSSKTITPSVIKSWGASSRTCGWRRMPQLSSA